MGKVNIDLSWLASLLTKTPTATKNPDYIDPDAQDNGDGTTGSDKGKMIDGIGYQQTDQDGNPIPTQKINLPSKNKSSNSFYTPPSNWQRLVHPNEAATIDQLNNQYISKPITENLENSTQLKIRQGNVKLLDPSLQPHTTPLSAAAAGYGQLDTSPTYINQQNQALLEAQHGVPGIQASTGINTAKYQNISSGGALDRATMEQGTLAQDLANRYATTYGLTPKQIQLAISQVAADQRFQPTVERIRDQALQNQFDEQNRIVPAEQNLAFTQTQNAQKVAEETGRLFPYTKTSMDNRAITDAATSRYVPLQEPYGGQIQDNGQIKTFQHNPLGASPYRVMMNNLQDLNGKNTQEVTLPNGKKGTAKVNNTSDMVDPLYRLFNIPPSGGPSETTAPSGAPTITSTNGPTVTHDQSGSMAPPVSQSLSSNTLGSTDSTSTKLYGNAGTNDADFFGRSKTTTGISNQLHEILSRHDKTIAPSSSMNPVMSKEEATDFISRNAKSMSHDELKQALTLMHQLPD